MTRTPSASMDSTTGEPVASSASPSKKKKSSSRGSKSATDAIGEPPSTESSVIAEIVRNALTTIRHGKRWVETGEGEELLWDLIPQKSDGSKTSVDGDGGKNQKYQKAFERFLEIVACDVVCHEQNSNTSVVSASRIKKRKKKWIKWLREFYLDHVNQVLHDYLTLFLLRNSSGANDGPEEADQNKKDDFKQTSLSEDAQSWDKTGHEGMDNEKPAWESQQKSTIPRKRKKDHHDRDVNDRPIKSHHGDHGTISGGNFPPHSQMEGREAGTQLANPAEQTSREQCHEKVRMSDDAVALEHPTSGNVDEDEGIVEDFDDRSRSSSARKRKKKKSKKEERRKKSKKDKKKSKIREKKIKNNNEGRGTISTDDEMERTGQDDKNHGDNEIDDDNVTQAAGEETSAPHPMPASSMQPPAPLVSSPIMSNVQYDQELYEEKQVEFEKYKDSILSQVRTIVRSRFRRPGFGRWQKKWLPILELSPFDVPPGPVRDQWFTMFENTKTSGRAMTHLVFWYGVTEDQMSEAYSFLPHNNIIPYEEGVEKFTTLPAKLQRKLEGKRSLTKFENQQVRGLEEIKADVTLEPEERISWMMQWRETWEEEFEEEHGISRKIATKESSFHPEARCETSPTDDKARKKVKKKRPRSEHGNQTKEIKKKTIQLHKDYEGDENELKLTKKKKKSKKEKVSEENADVDVEPERPVKKRKKVKEEETVVEAVVVVAKKKKKKKKRKYDEHLIMDEDDFDDDLSSDEDKDDDFVDGESGSEEDLDVAPSAKQKSKKKQLPGQNGEQSEDISLVKKKKKKSDISEEELDVNHENKLDVARDKDRKKRDEKRREKSDQEGMASLSEEQRKFEECERKFLPIMRRLQEAVDSMHGETARMCLSEIMSRVEDVTPPFIRSHMLGILIKRARVAFEREDPGVSSLSRNLTNELKRVFKEKNRFVPKEFEPNPSMLPCKEEPSVPVKMESTSGRIKSSEALPPFTKKVAPKKEDSMTSEQSASFHEVKISKKNRKEIAGFPSVPRKVENGTEHTISGEAPTINGLENPGLITKKTKCLSSRRPGPSDRALVSSASRRSAGGLDLWICGPSPDADEWQTNIESHTEREARSLGMELLVEVSSENFPTETVNPGTFSFSLEKAIFDRSKLISEVRTGSKESWLPEVYWEMIHDIAAAITGKKSEGSIVHRILAGEFSQPKDLVQMKRKILFQSFEAP